jgi:hypothetical protein
MGAMMKFRRRQFLHLAAGAAAVPAVSRFAMAQTTYPTRPITIVVGFAAGGPADTIARILADAPTPRRRYRRHYGSARFQSPKARDHLPVSQSGEN